MSELIEVTTQLVEMRKKPGTQERFKSYPALLKRFQELIADCEEPALLEQVIALDSGYFLLAGYRQQTLERLLMLSRTPQNLRAYALQLELFGDVDNFGEADLEIDERVAALYREADQLAASSGSA